jgi:Protein of unknown function (DUF1329)
MNGRPVVLISFAALACGATMAAVTPEQADRLGKDLTPIGAERAGNRDGTIPAYEGGEAPLPGWSWGKVRSRYSKFKDEQPLFSIDASSVDRYAGHLTEAQITALKTVPGYRMDVYPSHRTCNIDATYAERTRQNATDARIGADGWSLEHAKTAGVPFPIPQSGVEALYNSRMRPQGIGYRLTDGTTMISPRPGSREFTSYAWSLEVFLPSHRAAKASVESDGAVDFYLHYAYAEPAAMRGQAFIGISFENKDPESYYYFPGQRRVRRLPNYVFDAPVVGYENQYLNDEQLMLWSTLDRFEYRLVGKQEIYVQNNSLKMHDFDAKREDVFGKAFVNPAYRRFELHRVWVVDARLKPAFKHLVPHRVYYLDEDSWSIAAVTEYDQDGKVWKLMESSQIPIWELGGSCGYVAYTIWDLKGGRYVADFSVIGTGTDVKWIRPDDPDASQPQFKADFYTPETLRAISER